MIKKQLNLSNKVLIIIVALFASYLVFPSNFQNYLYPIIYDNDLLWKSLDPSWIITLNYASLKHLVWGKDFVFTFGPLGYLSTKFLWGSNKTSVLLFDFFVSINFFLLFYNTIQSSSKKAFAIVLILLVSLTLPGYFGSSIALILFTFLIYWILQSNNTFKYYNYGLQILIVVFLFYIKINTGLIALLFFTIALLYNSIVKVIKPIPFLLILVIPFISIYTLSIIFNVSIYSYILNSLELIKGYNDVQYLDIPENKHFYFFVLPLLLLLLSIFVLELKKAKHLKEKAKTIMTFFYLGSLWFIVYKQAFVRADVYHIVEYFIASNLILVVINALFFEGYKKGILISTIVIFIINITIIKQNTNQVDTITEKFSKKNYFNSFIEFTPIASLKIFPNANELPLKIKNSVGTNSIDVYPWNSMMLFENKMNFTPRPVFQSYATYTKTLQNLNFEFYNSDKAPEFVIYDVCAIDDRYAFFDDAKINLVLSQNYIVKDTFNYKNRNLLLLKKDHQKHKIRLTKDKEYAIFIGDLLQPKPNVFYEIGVYENFYGKAYSFFFHAPPLKLEIKTKYQSKFYKTSKELLNAGLFSENYISNTTEFTEMMNSKLTPYNQANYYRIEPQNKSMFKDKIRVTEYKITQ